ncbi:hypothetical protein ACFWBV_35425, partial [Streptomyces sp. NPDC060030]|uniref:hypothetical protein n=1 Tax=Streptomyces sp. NPDC060030 TaxID=3347042 RepID=UPI0036ACCB4C
MADEAATAPVEPAIHQASPDATHINEPGAAAHTSSMPGFDYTRDPDSDAAPPSDGVNGTLGVGKAGGAEAAGSFNVATELGEAVSPRVHRDRDRSELLEAIALTREGHRQQWPPRPNPVDRGGADSLSPQALSEQDCLTLLTSYFRYIPTNMAEIDANSTRKGLEKALLETNLSPRARVNAQRIIQNLKDDSRLNSNGEAARAISSPADAPSDTRPRTSGTTTGNPSANAVTTPGLQNPRISTARALHHPGNVAPLADDIRTNTPTHSRYSPNGIPAGPRSARSSKIYRTLAGLNHFVAYRVGDDAHRDKWPVLTESSRNDSRKRTGPSFNAVKRLFSRKDVGSDTGIKNTRSPVQPTSPDSPGNLPADALSNKEAANMLTHAILDHRGQVAGLSLHDDSDWSARGPLWATYDARHTTYASYPYAQLMARPRETPWTGNTPFFITAHGEFNKAKTYVRTGKKKIVDASGLRRILLSNHHFQATLEKNPKTHLVLVICEAGLTGASSMAQQLADEVGLIVHAPNGKTVGPMSNSLGQTVITVYPEGTDAGVFRTFEPTHASVVGQSAPQIIGDSSQDPAHRTGQTNQLTRDVDLYHSVNNALAAIPTG